MKLQELKNKFPFPAVKPDINTLRPDGRPEGWCSGDNVRMFEAIVPADAKVIIDGGSWMGLSAWHFLRIAPKATVICVDTWAGSEEHKRSCPEILPRLYDIFISNMWEYRDRIIPIRIDGVTGLSGISKMGIKPDVVYIDWAHDYVSVKNDISAAVKLFPEATICGDDYRWEGVIKATEELRVERGLRFVGHDRCWRMARPAVSPYEMDLWDELIRKWTYKYCYGVEKYLHWWTQRARCDALVVACGLANCGPKRILDMSAGIGLFAYTLRYYGHDVTLTNPPGIETEIYRDAIELLGFSPAIDHEYEQGVFKALPPGIGDYDIIVSRALTVMSFWTALDMDAFIGDCLFHIMHGGYLLIAPNAFSDPVVMEKIKYKAEKSNVNSCVYYKIHKQEA